MLPFSSTSLLQPPPPATRLCHRIMDVCYFFCVFTVLSAPWFRYSAMYITGTLYKDKVKWRRFLDDMYGQEPEDELAPVPIPLSKVME
jgi:hypothetical protein